MKTNRLSPGRGRDEDRLKIEPHAALDVSVLPENILYIATSFLHLQEECTGLFL